MLLSLESWIIVGAFVVDIAGAAPAHRNGPGEAGPAGVEEHGTGATGFPRNLGGPDRLQAT